MRIQKVCLHCKGVFTARKTITKFCSLDCAQKDYKQRMRTLRINDAKEKARKEMTDVVDGKNTSRPGTVLQMGEKLLINVNELALVIGMSRRTIFNLMEDKKFPRIKVGRKLLFDKNQVVEFVKHKYGKI